MILLDTSALVEYDRGTGSDVHLRVRELIRAGEPAVTEPVAMEVLSGAGDTAREQDLRRFLTGLGWLPFEAVTDFDGAVRIYRRCRRAGVTPRGLIDCMIAAVAIRTGTALLAHDRDLAAIATVMDLELDPATTR